MGVAMMARYWTKNPDKPWQYFSPDGKAIATHHHSGREHWYSLNIDGRHITEPFWGYTKYFYTLAEAKYWIEEKFNQPKENENESN